MSTLSQPTKGIIAVVLVLTVSLLFSAAFSPEVFGSWTAFLLMACIPTQIVCGLVWQCQYPNVAATLPQPAKGIAFVVITVLGGAIAAAAMWATVGGKMTPTPPLMMYTIFTIVMAFWLVAVWQTWPISALTQHPLLIGLGLLALCYLGGYVLFSLLFDFSFLAGAPIYVEALDPKGAFMAWQPMSFAVTTVAVIMLCLLCDFWPVGTISAAQNNPLIFKLLASLWILLVASIIFYIATELMQIDYVVYMVRGPVCIIFGAFILLNLMQLSLFSAVPQPIKGLLLSLVCIVLAALTQILYETASTVLVGPLHSGLPSYDLELWIANAMLAVTFPFIVVFTDFLHFWPLDREANESRGETSHG